MSNQRPDIAELKGTAQQLRREILQMLNTAGSGHPGGSLSEVELLTGLYWYALRHDPKRPDWPERDRFVLSKGHGCPGLYVVLANQGYFPKEELGTLRRHGTRLQGHPQRGLPGLEIASGSLGQGISVALGMAFAAKLDGADRRVWCLIGDGESDEGQVWEAAMAAAHYQLDRFHVIVDANGLQQNGPTKDVMNVEPLPDKWRAFGWEVVEIDGHDIEAVLKAYDTVRTVRGKPSVVVARTVKGKGVSFMEGQKQWHGVAPNDDELQVALEEIGRG